MEYLLQEGSFSLFPANWQDTSMTVLRDNNSGLSIVVSRGTIPHRFTTRGFDRLPPAAKSAEVELPKADEAVKYLGGY